MRLNMVRHHFSNRFAVIGAGNMGRGVAASIARAGYEVIQYDRSESALTSSVAQNPQKIHAAAKLADCCDKVDAVLVTVSNEEAERAVFLGNEGLLNLSAEKVPPPIVLNLGTTSVAWARDLHNEASALGIPFLDAPVSGGPEGAANAQLTLMLGGNQSVVERANFIFKAIGKKYALMGGPGAGAAAKLVNQQLVIANAHAAAEALALAQKLDCDLKQLAALLNTSWGQSTMLDRAAGIILNSQATLEVKSAAPLRNFVKDIALVQAEALRVGVTANCLEPPRNILQHCAQHDLLHIDWAAVSVIASNRKKNLATLSDIPIPIPAETALQYRHEVAKMVHDKRLPVVPVVDDDPTGTQTVNNVSVLSYPWKDLKHLENQGCFFILANTRALPKAQAIERAKDIGQKLAAQMPKNMRCVASRSDSTLRGHFPAEVYALAEGLGWNDPIIILAPFFFQGNRLTANDIHYVADPKSGDLTPCAETEFAKDAAFGYKHSNLQDWVFEKSGRSPTASIGLDVIRNQGPQAVADIIFKAANSEQKPIVVVNALDRNDADCLALGIAYAQQRLVKRGFILRCAASLVAARCAVEQIPLLTANDIFKSCEPKKCLIVVGSYVEKTTRQLEHLIERFDSKAKVIELDAARVASFDKRDDEISRVINAVDSALQSKSSIVVLYSSRALVRDVCNQEQQHVSSLQIGDRVNEAICAVVASTIQKPSARNAFVVAKGGITSNDVAVKSLGVCRATVLGQVIPGVPVWRLGNETKIPGAPYVVFPGNVGTDESLADVIEILLKEVKVPLLTYSPTATTPKDILLEAREKGRAVGAFNLYNLEGVLAVRRAVERTALPAIVQFHPASFDFANTALLAACLDVAQSCTVAPILVALDHASSDDALDLALRRGVDYVMADGSRLEYNTNVAWTADVVNRATNSALKSSVAVEAELGLLAGEEDGLSVAEKHAKMTDPDIVADFVQRTKIDALAVTIGNVHGKYAREPNLDWARLDQIRNNAPEDLPLVLHGASGLPDNMLHRAISAGVCKFNVNTEVRAASRQAVKVASAADKDVLDIMKDSVDAMVPVIEAKLRAFAPTFS
uniref:Uncharacterized protein n=1 Tax=Aureoumbra lagunensis TaxID=44058 RepID=A0A7S3K3S6_9STRA